MEKQFQLEYNGQAVLQQDFNDLGETSGLADDRVLAELLRMTPYDGSTVSRGILPFHHSGSGGAATVAPNGASGKVLVNPFRAFIGSRTAVATDAQKNWRDIRSGLSVASGASTLGTGVSLAANASGHPRWDLVYAQVVVDAAGPTTTRKVKDVDTLVVTAETVSTVKVTSVTLGVITGTAATSPVWPTITADSGDTYYIPLAYVRVPNGFTSGSTVATTDIAVEAPILRLSRAAGATKFTVADQSYVVTTAQQQAWGSSGTRNLMWMPPEMNGGSETLLVVLDLDDASSANWSHQTGGVVDSRDWRNRVCKFNCLVHTGFSLGRDLPWNVAGTTGRTGVFSPYRLRHIAVPSSDDAYVSSGMSQTFHDGATSGDPANQSQVVVIEGDSFTDMTDASLIRLYVDHADNGKLKVYINGTNPDIYAVCWIEFSPPYTNR